MKLGVMIYGKTHCCSVFQLLFETYGAPKGSVLVLTIRPTASYAQKREKKVSCAHKKVCQMNSFKSRLSICGFLCDSTCLLSCALVSGSTNRWSHHTSVWQENIPYSMFSQSQRRPGTPDADGGSLFVIVFHFLNKFNNYVNCFCPWMWL